LLLDLATMANLKTLLDQFIARETG
jgi:hypothetical protein